MAFPTQVAPFSKMERVGNGAALGFSTSEVFSGKKLTLFKEFMDASGLRPKLAGVFGVLGEFETMLSVQLFVEAGLAKKRRETAIATQVGASCW